MGFNEAEAHAPRIRAAHKAALGEAQASMRPRRMRLGYTEEPLSHWTTELKASMRPRRMRLGYLAPHAPKKNRVVLQ